MASVPWKIFFGIFSSCTKRYSKINEEIADQKLRKIEKSFKKLIGTSTLPSPPFSIAIVNVIFRPAHKQDKASFVSRDSWDSFFKWCKQEVSAERKHELNFEPIVAIIAAVSILLSVYILEGTNCVYFCIQLLGLVYCKGIKFMKWHSTNTGADGSDESTSSSSERVYTDWGKFSSFVSGAKGSYNKLKTNFLLLCADLYEEEEKKQQKRRADENKGKIIVKIRFSRSLPLAFRYFVAQIQHTVHR